MSAYKDALSIATDARGPRLDMAVEVLVAGLGVVLLADRLALRPAGEQLLCEVITRLPEAARSAKALQAELDAGKQLLGASTIGAALRNPVREWLVVDDYGTGTIQLWPALMH